MRILLTQNLIIDAREVTNENADSQHCVRPLAGTLHIEIMMSFSRHYMAQESDMGIKGQTCSVLGNCA
ncbi:hypothetical protein XENTR_v10023407 [Xenopus tropicalis]|nr:hypothetical protein XENTR_v10023407 [Xenopus tropicalis]